LTGSRALVEGRTASHCLGASVFGLHRGERSLEHEFDECPRGWALPGQRAAVAGYDPNEGDTKVKVYIFDESASGVDAAQTRPHVNPLGAWAAPCP